MFKKFLLAISFLIISLLFTTPSFASDHMNHAISLSLSPQYKALKVGETVDVVFKANSGMTEVNAVTLVASYPLDQLGYLKTNLITSNFSLEVETIAKDGMIIISKGSTKPLVGDQTIASVQFKAKKNTSTSVIMINSEQSALMSSQDNQNLLHGSSETTPVVAPKKESVFSPLISLLQQIKQLFSNFSFN